MGGSLRGFLHFFALRNLRLLDLSGVKSEAAPILSRAQLAAMAAAWN